MEREQYERRKNHSNPQKSNKYKENKKQRKKSKNSMRVRKRDWEGIGRRLKRLRRNQKKASTTSGWRIAKHRGWTMKLGKQSRKKGVRGKRSTGGQLVIYQSSKIALEWVGNVFNRPKVGFLEWSYQQLRRGRNQWSQGSKKRMKKRLKEVVVGNTSVCGRRWRLGRSIDASCVLVKRQNGGWDPLMRRNIFNVILLGWVVPL